MLHHRPDAAARRAPGSRDALGRALLARGCIDATKLAWASLRARRSLVDPGAVLFAHGLVSARDLAACRAEVAGMPFVEDLAADPCAVARLGAGFCARHGVLPLPALGALRPVALRRPDRFHALRHRIEARLGQVAPVVATETAIADALYRSAGRSLAEQAETRAPAALSCRTLAAGRLLPFPRFAAIGLTVLLALILAPVPVLAGLTLLAMAVTAINCTLTVFAAVTALRPTPTRAATDGDLVLARLPVVTLLLPLLREENLAALLVERIARLDYPHELLDVLVIVEADDAVTAATLAKTRLPPWTRVVRVPRGTVRTKPRALNRALDIARGSIVGIYDAEDLPEPDQIRRVVDRFARSTPDVACLQGRLGFYNTGASWITRLFAIDYAGWFWLMLPALARLGWPIPLGGTTVFLRRDALEAVGGWDAHNVTEDADLGLRLARRGYRTELIDTTTTEEATARPATWLRQRSRWQKGYALTWASHMRAPLDLWRDLGTWPFIGMQILFLGGLGAAVLTPLLWSLLVMAFGVAHPIQAVVPAAALPAVYIGCAASLAITSAAALIGLSRTGALSLAPWITLLPLYHGLSSISVWKAAAEIVTRPFFWDKTAHGHSLGRAARLRDRGRGPTPS